jgi:amino acid transporter
MEYFFDRSPGGEFFLGYGLFIFFLLLFFSKSIVLKFAPHNKYFRKSIKKKFGKFIALGVIGLILVASRFSGIPIFSMRIWTYLVFLFTIVLGIWTFIRIRSEYRKRIRAVERETGRKFC